MNCYSSDQRCLCTLPGHVPLGVAQQIDWKWGARIGITEGTLIFILRWRLHLRSFQRRMFAWFREIGLRLLSTLGLYNKKATLVLLGKPGEY